MTVPLARKLLRSTSGEDGTGPAGLVFPGRVRAQGDQLEVVASTLLNDLEQRAPKGNPGELYLTGYAASRAEGAWRLRKATAYRGPSTGQVSIFELLGARPDPVRWHTRSLVGKQTRYIPRPQVESVLRGRDVGPLLRLSGPVGAGKSRLAWEVLTGAGRGQQMDEGDQTRPPIGPWIWLAIPPVRAPEPALGGQLLRGLVEVTAELAGGPSARSDVAELERATQELGLEDHAGWLAAEAPQVPPADFGPDALFDLAEQTLRAAASSWALPVRLIVDNLERADAGTRRRLLRLTGSHELRKACRVVLIGRPGHRWPGEWSRAPEVMVPPMTEDEIRAMGDGLFDRLLMPEETREAILEACGGFPLALEEGLGQLVYSRQVRQRYGNYFYAGKGKDPYRPSPYLIAVLDAEARRVSDSLSLRLLSLVDHPVPVEILKAASAGFGDLGGDQAQAPLATSGWLRPAASPWGPGLAFSCSAYHQALAATVAEDFRDTARHAVGHLLAHESDLPKARWYAYRLLSGTSEALSPVLDLAHNPPEGLSQDEILDSLTRELEALRERGGDPDQEVELLWVLLPLARRLDRLSELEGELPRALDLAGDRPEKLLAFASLQAEVSLQEGRLEESEENLRSALAVALRKDPGRQMVLLSQLGRLLARQERYREARTIFEQIRRSAGEDNEPLVASCDFHLGNIAFHQRRLDEALELHRQSLERAEELGLKTAVASSLCALGAVSLARGEPLAALDYYRRGLEAIEPAGDPAELAYALLGLARVETRLGRHTAAAPLLRRAVELRSNQTDPVGEAVARLALARNRLELERLEEAQTEARMAHFRLSLLSTNRALGQAELLLARIDFQQKRYKDSHKHLAAARVHFRRHQDPEALLEAELLALELALAERDLPAVRLVARGLTAHLAPDSTEPPPPWLKVPLGFTLFQAYRFLRGRGEDTPEPLGFLRQAYGELLDQVESLDPARRHHYLFQNSANAAILDAATTYQLTTPA